MIQRFIELGEGTSDLYELLELANNQQERVIRLLAMHTNTSGKDVVSLAIVMKPAAQGNFQPIYICREGIPDPRKKPNQRYRMFEDLAKSLEKDIIEFDIKPSSLFAEKELYYQYVTGILRMNHYLPPLS